MLPLSCPSMASNYANLYLVLISFWMLIIPWTFLEAEKPQFPILFYRRASLFCDVSDKSAALLFWPCSHKKAVAHIGDFQNVG